MLAYILVLGGYKVSILMRLSVPRECKRDFLVSMGVIYASLIVFVVLVVR
jgi:hypothetical protein